VSAVQKLGSLELGRGIASLAVVAHHAAQSSDAFNSAKFGSYFHTGALGVDFFFVLSGFIIYHVHQDDSQTLPAAKKFFGKRVHRIYIPYLPISLALILAYTAFPSLSQGEREWGLFTSLTLLPTSSPPALSVAWTLVFEMMFYISFLVFYVSRYFCLVIMVWTAATITSAILGSTDYMDGALFRTFLNPLILEFVAGMLAALLFKRMSPGYWALPTLIGVSLSVCYFMIGDLHRALFGISLAPLVLGLALAETKFNFRPPSWALLLGAASYSIYLIHNPLQSLVARVASGSDNWTLTFFACFTSGIIAGILYHLWYEKPALRLFRFRDNRRTVQYGITD
tara:strand:- start:7355 stop:8374 length:1020 start_codon:yes stop_codon:yes gene_type:complete